MSLTVNLINPKSITAWLISTATSGDVVEAMNAVAPLGWAGTVTAVEQKNSGGVVVWTVVLQRNGYKNLTGTNGSWIVSDGEHVDIFTGDQFMATYTANVEMAWASIESPPFAQAEIGASATVTFPSPTSPNGPFTYALTVTNTTTKTTSQVTDPAVANGMVTFTINDLTAGDNYAFVARVTTPYGSTNSAASNSITAIS